MATRTRRRRGNPRGKALGFRGLKPAKTKSDAASQTSVSETSAASVSQPTGS